MITEKNFSVVIEKNFYCLKANDFFSFVLKKHIKKNLLLRRVLEIKG
jgi:hypothetical protein